MSELAAPLDGSSPALGLREEEDEELIMNLERDQLVAATFLPVEPARLDHRTVVGLWALRVFVVAVSAMVIYTFIVRLQ